jgi:hypothetical protein
MSTLSRLALRLALALCVWCVGVDARAQIGGVINDYAAVVGITTCSNVMAVDDASAFRVGDMVLIIQMQGAVVDPSTGRVTSYAGAGRFERNYVGAIAGNDIMLERRISQPFDASGRVQMVRMPVFDDVIVDSVLTCKPWDGRTGGVCAFAARGQVVLLNDIDVSGRGFRAAIGERRGEGIAVDSGRVGTAWTTGGSKCLSKAGGGGAHHGAGGSGGCNGGYEASYTTGSNRIFMGGAGGGSESTADTMWSVLSTGAGGGIVLIDADRISGDRQHIIRATGNDGTASVQNSGGGGAGGAILLTAKIIENVPELVVFGGAGSDAVQRGAGGGGGGGTILLGTINPLNLNPSTYAGGRGGRSGASENGTDGTDGRVYPNCTINGDTTRFIPFSYDISPDTTVCYGEQATLSVDGAVSVEWYDESGTLVCDTCRSLTVTVTQPLRYIIIVRTPAGCRDTSIATIGMYAPVAFIISDPPSICPGDITAITAPHGYVTYQWSTGATTRSISVAEAGVYTATVTDSNGCSGSASATVRHQNAGAVEIDAASIAPAVVQAGERICQTVRVRNLTDTTVAVTRAWMQGNVEFSVPPSQAPIVITEHGDASCTYCFAARMPGDYVDTLIIEGGCGRSQHVVRATALESVWYTRCAVRITSQGEREEFVLLPVAEQVRALVYDVLGRMQGEVTSDVVSMAEHGAVHRFDLSSFPAGVLFVMLR